jgi:hypothetical protein
MSTTQIDISIKQFQDKEDITGDGRSSYLTSRTDPKVEVINCEKKIY